MRCKRQRMNLITRRKEPASCCRPASAPLSLSPSLSLPGRHVRVVVTPGCNVNQLHYHKLLLAYVSVFLRRSEQEVPYQHCEFLDSKVKKESGNTFEAILED